MYYDNVSVDYLPATYFAVLTKCPLSAHVLFPGHLIQLMQTERSFGMWMCRVMKPEM